jgi:hypothetical protein
MASVALACVFVATAHASPYKMLLCAGNNGSNGFQTATNTISGAQPGGIFSFENYCGPAGDPAGNAAFLRIAEQMPNGNAGVNAYGSMSWTAPGFVSIAAGGGYTREPNAFNDGWRGRFWAEGYDGSTNNILMQGSGVGGGGIFWGTTSTFAPHLWPFGGYGSYRRFVFELTCVRPAGCDRTNFNAVDANTLNLILDDVSPSQIGLTGGPIASGAWVRGAQGVTWNTSDLGSGLRFERVKVDGGVRQQLDWRGSCNLDWTPTSGEFARDFQPCPTGGPYGRSYTFDTATVSDGQHTVQVCSQDYGQAVNGQESCDQRTVRVDNTPPSAPAALAVTSANPARYLDQFGATWKLPADPGSPVTKVHYNIVDAAGKVVVPEKIVGGTNPTKLDAIEGPKAAGDYRLRVWLEDQVGFAGPVATVPIPHDTTPPAAPQDVSVTAPDTPRSAQGVDVRWRNIVDAGAPIDAVHYEVVNGGGKVVVPAVTVSGANPQGVSNLDTPRDRGEYTLRLWLSDAEGNVGAPVKVPIAFDCTRSDAGAAASLSAGLGKKAKDSLLLPQGKATTISGQLAASGGPLGNAPLCVFSRVVTSNERRFVGVAMTDDDGSYRFPIADGPSRDLSVVYRPDSRELAARASVETKVKPTFRLVGKGPVHNKERAVFKGSIPGPENEKVVVVLQVKSGKGWRVFRRARTHKGGRFTLRYLFTQTYRPTTYTMRAQVRAQSGYPYRAGESESIPVPVRP